MTKNDRDPLDGYRPDMDQYRNVNDEVDGAYKMLGNLMLVVLVVVGALLTLAIYNGLTMLLNFIARFL